MLAAMVSEAGVTALVPVSITFLTEDLKMEGLEIGIVFAIALIGSLPGTFVGAYASSKTNPKVSWIINLISWVLVTLSGAFALTEERSYLAFLWAFLWGILLGWFYPVQNRFFSLAVPLGQEAEMTGFVVYTSQVLAWLPPMVVSVMVSGGVSTRWGFLRFVSRGASFDPILY